MVAADGAYGVSAGAAVADHGRRGRFERQPQSAVEGGVAEVRGRYGAARIGVSLSAGNEQVEQDRASDVLSHHGELAWATVGESGGGGELDRAHEDEERLRPGAGRGGPTSGPRRSSGASSPEGSRTIPR